MTMCKNIKKRQTYDILKLLVTVGNKIISTKRRGWVEILHKPFLITELEVKFEQEFV